MARCSPLSLEAPAGSCVWPECGLPSEPCHHVSSPCEVEGMGAGGVVWCHGVIPWSSAPPPLTDCRAEAL